MGDEMFANMYDLSEGPDLINASKEEIFSYIRGREEAGLKLHINCVRQIPLSITHEYYHPKKNVDPIVWLKDYNGKTYPQYSSMTDEQRIAYIKRGNMHSTFAADMPSEDRKRYGEIIKKRKGEFISAGHYRGGHIMSGEEADAEFEIAVGSLEGLVKE